MPLLKGKLSVTNTSQSFGPNVSRLPPFTLQVVGGTVFFGFMGEDAIDDSGFNLADGKDISSDQLPEAFLQGQMSAVTTSTATLYYHFG